MNSDTAELAISRERGRAGSPPAPPLPRAAAGWLRPLAARLRADGTDDCRARQLAGAVELARCSCGRPAWAPCLRSASAPSAKPSTRPGVTGGFGWLGDLLAAPAARWDSAWYLVIAHYGYRPDLGAYTSSRTAFFPLYPLGLRAIAWLGAPPVLAGVLLSVAALAVALYGIHRLTTLELARRAGGSLAGDRLAGAARLAVLLTAFAPMAFFLSAVYSESLYLALSVGLFWSARNGRWAWVGVLGALAGATRSTGLVLLVPALIIYLYGPREDRAPDRVTDRDRPTARVGASGQLSSRLRVPAWAIPRYRLRRDVAVAGAAAGGRASLYGAVPRGSRAATRWRRCTPRKCGAGTSRAPTWASGTACRRRSRAPASCCRCSAATSTSPTGSDSPFVCAGHNLMLLAFLLAAVPAVVGVLRRLPLAYGAYVLAALALPLSYPVSDAAADVAAALPAGAVPARHLAGGVAGRASPRCSGRCSCCSGAADGGVRWRSSPPGTGWPRRWTSPRGSAVEPSAAESAAPLGRETPAGPPLDRAARWRCSAALVLATLWRAACSTSRRRSLFGVKITSTHTARRACRSPTRSCRTSASCVVRRVLRAAGRAGRALVAVRPAPPGRRAGGGAARLIVRCCWSRSSC